ncbi:MAG: hypothetical protein ACREQY_22800 [Candidatus Binatia bacterium]
MSLRSARGQILAPVVVVTAALLVAGVATLQLVRGQLRANADQVAVQKAFYVADAGIQRGVAQLDQDRTTASTSLTYSYSTTESLGDGSYAVSVSQDSLYPTDPTRKQIQSTGSIGGAQSTTVAHVLVQDDEPCAICSSAAGDCRFVTNVGASTSLFNGLIHSNRDVVFNVAAGLDLDASGEVRAVRNITNQGLTLLSEVGANAFRGGSFNSSLDTITVLGIPVHSNKGVHFNNGTNKHGVQQAVATRTFPHPDYDRIQRDPQTIIINDDNAPPFGSWDSANDIWTYSGTFAFPTSPEVIYYVDGDVSLGTILLAGNSTATIVARGWITFDKLDLVTSALGVGVNLAEGADGTSSLITVTNGTVQNIHLIGEDQVNVGRPLLSTVPLLFGLDSDAVAGAVSGIALSALSVGSTETRVTAYSETSTVWGKIALGSLYGGAEVSFTGYQDTTLAYTGSLGSDTLCPY